MNLSLFSQNNFFQKAIGGNQNDEGRQIQQTSDGGFINFGSTKSYGNGSYDIYMIKTSANGNVLWSKVVGGTSDEHCFSGRQTTDGGYILAGYTQSFGSAEEAFLIKTDNVGTIQWSRRFGGASDERAYSVVQSSDGGYAFTGSVRSWGAGSDDAYVVKVDALGNLQFSIAYGGTNTDIGRSIYQTATGMFIVTGETRSFGAGQEDAFLLKVSNTGSLQYFKTFGGAAKDYGSSIIQMSNGKYLIGGTTRSFGAGNDDAWLINTDTLGLLQFSRTYGGAGADLCNSIKETSAGTFVFAGSTTSFGSGSDDAYLIRTNSSGGLITSRCYGGTNADFAYSVNQMSSGQFIILGMTNSFGVGITDYYLLRTDTAGNTGCNQTAPATIVNNPALVSGNVAPTVTSGGAANTVAFSTISNVDLTTMLCQCIAPPNITGPNSLCPGGSATLAASGGTSFVWNTSATTSTLAVSPTITTSYTVTVSNGSCSDTTSFKVNVNPNPVINISPSSATMCVGNSTVLTASGGTAYAWSPGTGLSCISCSSPTASPVSSTVYTVTGTDANGCSGTKTISIVVNGLPTINITPASATICAGNITSLTATGATSYSWLPTTALSCTNCSGPLANPVSTTVYTVTGVNSNGCINTKTIQVVVNPLPVITISPPSATFCAGSSTFLTASGANSYSWSPSTGLSCTNCVSPLANPSVTTTYTITGADLNSCTNTKTIAIIVNPLPVITVNPPSATICIGSSVNYNASGASTYTWSPSTALSCVNCNNPTSNPNSNITYTITGTDANGCVNTTTAGVLVNPLPVINISPASATFCAGGSTVLTASGANVYAWSPSTGLSCTNCANPNASPATSIVYSVSGIDGNGCVNSKTVSITVNPLPVIAINPSSATVCIGNSTVLTASGATNYSWSPASSLSCSNCAGPNASPTVTTTYTVTGSNLNGCVNTATVNMVVNPLPAISIAPPSATFCIGSSTALTASGANVYNWSPSAGLSCTNCANPNANPSVTTTYTVTGTNANNCVNTNTVNIVVNPLPVINVSPASATFCAGTSTVLSASGGTVYAWSPSTGLSCTNCASPISSPTVSVTYTVTGTNANGCVNTKTVGIIVNPLPVLSSAPPSATLCAGSSTVITISGANNYSWSPASGLSCSNCAGPTANPTVSTVYTITGSDLNGCSSTTTVNVIVNPLPSVTVSPGSATFCIGSSTVLNASGAVSYAWSPSAGLSCTNCANPSANPTITTTYTVTGTNANGCISTKTANIIVNPLPNISVAPPSVTFCVNSSTVLIASGANSYSWSPATGLSCTGCSSPNANPTTSTTYTVTGTDINGCTNTKTIAVTVNPLPVISINPSSATLCAGNSTVLTASGATSYTWSPSTGLSCGNCPNPTTSPTVSTTYTVTGSDLNGCVNSVSVGVIVNPLPTLTVTPPSATFCIGGSTVFNVSGAGSYIWSPSTGLSCTNCPGPTANPTTNITYTVTGTNANGCTSTKQVTVVVNSLPVINVNPASAAFCVGSSTLLSASGASTFTWSPPAGLSCSACPIPVANPTTSTIYTVTGTDVNGCVNSKSVSITVYPLPIINVNPASASICIGNTVALNASGAQSYVWSPATALSCTNCANPSANPSSTTIYTVTGTDINGCTGTVTVGITVNPLPVINISPASATFCAGNSVAFTASGANNYFWSPPTALSCTNCSNPTANPNSSIIYTVSGIDVNGCVNTKTVGVTVIPLPVVSVSPPTATFCIGSSTVLTASGANNYTWSPGTGLSCTNCSGPTASPTTNITYTVTGSNLNGCLNTATVGITINPLPLVNVNPVTTSICVGSSSSFTASGAISYIWSPNAGLSCTNCANPSSNPSVTTVYTVTGINANGCSGTATATMIVNPLPVVNVSPISATFCVGSSVTFTASGANAYFWSPPTGLSCTNCPSPSANPNSNITYTVTGINVNGCSNTKTVGVTVNSLPIVSASPPTATFCIGSSSVLTASGANNYTWSPGTSLSCTNCASPVASPTANIVYTVTGSNLNGCSNSATVGVTINPLPSINVNPFSASLCIGSSTSFTASGGVSYLWSPTSGLSCTNCANPSANPSVSTVYTVTGTNSNGCSGIATATITVNTLPVINISPGSATLCVGGNVVLTASGANNYFWSPITGLSCTNCPSPTSGPSSSIVYTVTGVSINGCTNTKTVGVTVNPLPIISVSPPTATFCTGSFTTLTASGANNYIWSPATALTCTNCASTNASPTVNTTYTVAGSDLNGCTNTTTVGITINPLPSININPVSTSVCIGSSTGFTVSGGVSYVWSPTVGLSCANCANPSASPSVSTVYTATGTDANGCFGSATATIIVNPLPVINISPASATFCAGGSVAFTASGANNYFWSPTTGLSCTNCPAPTANPNLSITYTVSGVNANGCTNTKTVGVSVIPLPIISVSPPTATFCIGSSTVLTASGANNYIWSPATALSCSNCVSTNASPTVSTTYTVTGSDLNGCTNTTTVGITINPLPNLSISPPSATFCVGNSTVLSASGAVSYIWSPATALSCTNCANPTANPTVSTVYTLSGTNANGCTNTATVSIVVNPLPNISCSPSSATFCVGSFTILSASGAANYAWAPLAGLSCTNCPSPTASPTITTTYTLTGTNANGCINNIQIPITVYPLPAINISPSSATFCAGNSAALNASGATAYTWTPASGLSCTVCTSPVASPSVTTIYTVTGSNANNCFNTNTIGITVNPLPAVSVNPPSISFCAGGSTVLTASGAQNYVWTPAAGLSCTNCANPTANPGVSTTYSVTGIDANGCVKTITVQVNVNPLPNIVINPASATLCVGNSTLLGASGAVNYAWSPSAGLSCTNCPSPIAGPTVSTTYTITGTDANGCVNTKTIVIVINPLPTLTVSASPAAYCIGGSAFLSASGATNFTWSPATALSCTNCAGVSANPTVSTTYTITGTDLNGCANFTTVNVIVNPLPVISISPPSATFCVSGSTVLAASGANTFSWTPGSGLSCTNCISPVANPTVSTNYTVSGTDANGCINSTTVGIIVSPLPVITVTPPASTFCVGGSTILSASGANSYVWSPISGLSCTNCPAPTAGPTVSTIYTVTGTDVNGCVNTKTVSLTVNPLPSLTLNPTSATMCVGAFTLLNVSGANNYSWSPSAGLSCTNCASASANPTSSTVYTVTASDLNSCVNSGTVSVIINPLPVISVTPPAVAYCVGSSTVLTASGAQTFTWLPAAGLSCSICASPNVTAGSTTAYTVTGTDINGCVNNAIVNVTVHPLPVINVSPPSATFCAGSSTLLNASGANNYAWLPPAGLSCTNCPIPNASPSVSTIYTVTGTDLLGCSGTKTVGITVIPLPTISITPPAATLCVGSSTFIFATGATNYTWLPSSGLSCSNCPSPLAGPTVNTTYTVSGTDLNGCINYASVSVTVNPLPSIAINPANVSFCDGGSTTFTANGAGSYTWSPATGLSCTTCANPTASPNVTTTYTVIGANSYECVNSQTITVTVFPLPSVTISPAAPVICQGASTVLSGSGANNYLWMPPIDLSCSSCQSPTASPAAVIVYTVTGYSSEGCTSTTTVLVNVLSKPDVTVAPFSPTICAGTATLLTAMGANNYTWTPSAGLSCTNCANPAASPIIGTTYTVTGTDFNGCKDVKRYTIVVGSPINGTLVGDTVLCLGNSMSIVASGGGNYLWHDSTTISYIVVSPTVTTTYSVVISKMGCYDTLSKTVIVNPIPTASAATHTTISYGNSVQLQGYGGGSYQWLPYTGLSCDQCSAPVANPTITTEYVLAVTNEFGCIDYDTIVVTVDYICGEIFVPNVFSPNGDGQNDILYVENKCITYLDFVIYDRWGEKVFSTNDQNEGWDGTLRGVPMNGAGFVYYLRARMAGSEEYIVKKGNIMILK